MADRHPHGTTWHAYEESSAPMTGAAANQTRAARSNGNDARSRSGVSKGGHEPARNCRYPPVVNSRFDNNNAIASSLNSEQQQVVHHRAREARNEFQVLFTHQKTKKKKSWKDGRLVLVGTRCSLYDAVALPGSSGGAIDALDLNPREAQLLRQANFLEDNLESEKFLIQVEGPWIDAPAASGSSACNSNNPLWNKQQLSFNSRNASNNIGARVGRKPPSQSAGMKRLMSNKFKVPSRVRPLHPEEKRRRALANSGMNKRNRPLQPGELERQYYGDGGMNGCYEKNIGFQQGGGDDQHERGSCNQRDQGRGSIHQNGQYFNNPQQSRGDPSVYDRRWETHRPDDASQSSSQGHSNSIERPQHSDQNKGGRSDTIGRRTNPDGGTNSNDQRQVNRSYVQPTPMGSRPPQGRLNNIGSRNQAGSRSAASIQFQSNNCDPNGFYAEESDDEGCDQHTQQNGQGHVGRDFDHHQQLDSMQNGSVNRYHDVNRSVRFENEMDGDSAANEQRSDQQISQHNSQSEQSYSQEDELLALLGAVPQNETRQDMKSGNAGAPANVEGTSADALNQRGFMAGLLARESQIDDQTNNRISLGTNLSSFSFSDRLGSGDDLSEEDNEGEGPKQFGFTLPSPGESSDEEEESDEEEIN